MSDERMFPLQAGYSRDARPGPLSIPWSVAEKAYGVYAARYGRSQSLERLAQRGGFGTGEMDDLYPNWRVEVDEITKLKARVAELEERNTRLEDCFNDVLRELRHSDSLDATQIGHVCAIINTVIA